MEPVASRSAATPADRNTTASAVILRTISLSEAYPLAARSNPNLAVARRAIEQAQGLQTQAQARFWPVVTLNGSWTHNDHEAVLETPRYGTGGTTEQPNATDQLPIERRLITAQDALSMDLRMDVPLFEGPSIPAYQNARDQVDASRLQARWAGQQLLMTVANQYFRTLLFQRAMASLQASEAMAVTHWKSAMHQMDLGLLGRVAVIRAEMQLQETRERAAKATHDWLAESQALGILLGLQQPLRVAESNVVRQPGIDEEKLMREAASQRLDCRAAAVDLANRKRDITAAGLAFLPVISGSIVYHVSNETRFVNRYDSWQVGINLTMPLFDGGARYGALQSARAGWNMAQDQYRQCVEKAQDDVVRAHHRLHGFLESLVASQQRLALAQESNAAIQKAYEARAAAIMEVLEANRTLTDAQLAVINDEVGRDLSWISLLFAAGQFEPLTVNSPMIP